MSNSKGTGNRYASIDALEDKARRQARGVGLFISYKCEICGKNRGPHFNHDKCSKILQQQRVMAVI